MSKDLKLNLTSYLHASMFCEKIERNLEAIKIITSMRVYNKQDVLAQIQAAKNSLKQLEEIYGMGQPGQE